MAYRVIHQVSRARRVVTVRVDRDDGPLPRKHRKGDGGLLTWLVGRVPSLASESMSQGEGKDGRQECYSNDRLHVYLPLMVGGEMPPLVRLCRCELGGMSQEAGVGSSSKRSAIPSKSTSVPSGTTMMSPP